MQAVLQSLQGAECVEAWIRYSFGQGQFVPVLGHYGHGSFFHGNLLLLFSPAQECQRLQDGVRRSWATKLNGLEQHRKESPYLTVMVDELIKIAGFVLATADTELRSSDE